jgi:hypothetical protein
MCHLLGVVFSISNEMDIEIWSLVAYRTGVDGFWNCRSSMGDLNVVALGSRKVDMVKDGLFS